MKMTVFLLLMASPEWLALDRPARAEIAEAALSHAFASHDLALRFFDAEAFNARVSDVAMIEAANSEAYYFVMERLRDTPLFSKPYFRLVDIIPAFEDGFRAFDNAQ
jgi:hypothetical protein